MAEVIKYAMIRDASLLDIIKGGTAKKNIIEVIRRCVSIKRDVVLEDERDTGIRAILNFGHTAAHSIEAESCFNISHGRAVAIGMAIITRASVKLGLCGADAYRTLCGILSDYSLPLECEYDAQTIYEHALSDKKRESSGISLVMCTGVGSCDVQKTPFEKVKQVFVLGTEK